MSFILHSLDLIWIPICFFVVAKPHRLYAATFALCCSLMLRMQYELIEEWGFGTEGFPDFLLSSNPYNRGQVIYAIIMVLYLLLSHYSRKTPPVIYMAASLTIFIFAFILSFILMSL